MLLIIEQNFNYFNLILFFEDVITRQNDQYGLFRCLIVPTNYNFDSEILNDQ